MLATYNVVPYLITKKRIMKFMEKTMTEPKYIEYLQEWHMRTKRERRSLFKSNDYFDE